MKQGTLLIRADANVAIGTGHVMRCLALAEAWQDAGGQVVLATAEMPSALESRLTASGISVFHVEAVPSSGEDAGATASCAQRVRAAWLVVDGDRFGSDYLASLRHGSSRVLLIDDFAGRNAFPADLIVNPNLGAETELYLGKSPEALVLTGPRYVLLRREFQKQIRERQFAEHGKRILITLGGSDPEKLTPRVAAALASCSKFELTVVAGAGYPNVDDLQRLTAANLSVIVDTQNMAKLMMDADIAVIAAGGTLWELLSTGCAVLSYSRNAVQLRVVQALARDGVIVDVGDTARFDPAKIEAAVESLAESVSTRKRMAEQGRRLVDGRGAARVVEAIQQYGVR